MNAHAERKICEYPAKQMASSSVTKNNMPQGAGAVTTEQPCLALDNYPQEALANFYALLRSADFSAELAVLGVGRFQFTLRRRMLQEFESLYVALWRMALGRSFPDEAEYIFDMFCSNYTQRKDKKKEEMVGRAREYWAMLRATGNRDFFSVAAHLASFVTFDEDKTKKIVLKLALHLRALYQCIFERLI